MIAPSLFFVFGALCGIVGLLLGRLPRTASMEVLRLLFALRFPGSRAARHTAT